MSPHRGLLEGANIILVIRGGGDKNRRKFGYEGELAIRVGHLTDIQYSNPAGTPHSSPQG